MRWLEEYSWEDFGESVQWHIRERVSLWPTKMGNVEGRLPGFKTRVINNSYIPVSEEQLMYHCIHWIYVNLAQVLLFSKAPRTAVKLLICVQKFEGLSDKFKSQPGLGHTDNGWIFKQGIEGNQIIIRVSFNNII